MMLLSFQRQVIEEQLANAKQRNQNKRNSPNGTECAAMSIDNGSSTGAPTVVTR